MMTTFVVIGTKIKGKIPKSIQINIRNRPDDL